MINVLSVISELKFGGGENRLLNIARSIDSRRFRHAVATIYSPSRTLQNHCGTLLKQFADAGIQVHQLGLTHPSDFAAVRPLKVASTAATLATAIAGLRRLIVSTRADLVDAHLQTALYTAVPAAVATGVPASITLYSELDLWKIFDKRVSQQLFLPRLRRFNLRLCSAIVTDSQARASDFARFLGPSAPPLLVIPNGVRLDPPAHSRGEVLRHFGIPPETRAKIVGQVAGLVPYKGGALLLDAAKRAVDAGHDLYLLLVGDARVGPAYPLQLRQQAERLGISGRVRIGGYPGNIADVWSVIDLHVHASSLDSLPNAILEGMSLGKPAVVTSVGAIPEHVENGRTGLVVAPGDRQALGDALLRLLSDEPFAGQLGRGAYQRYLERFTPERTTRAIEQSFESILGAHRGRRATAS